MLPVTAYSTPGPGEPFEKTTIERRELGPHDVLIKIAFAGICHSDIHTARGEWGPVIYPLVPGHEIAGTVESIGNDVTRHRVGDRVGVGCMVDSCRQCEPCLAGEEQHCLQGSIDTYNSIGRDGRPTEGGYSTHVVVDDAFTLRIPDRLPLSTAAPLLCAGITVYSPLRHWGAGQGKKVAIVGLGGLGHMGVKIAHAFGAEVTVLSQTLSKQNDGPRLGATHYYATSDQRTFDELRGTFDLIIDTVSGPHDIDAYLSLLTLDGTLVFVGAPPESLSLMVASLQTNRRAVAGSSIGGIRETQEMLDFCAEHHIESDVEIIRGDQIDEAWDRVMSSDVRYRFVIDTATF